MIAIMVRWERYVNYLLYSNIMTLCWNFNSHKWRRFTSPTDSFLLNKLQHNVHSINTYKNTQDRPSLTTFTANGIRWNKKSQWVSVKFPMRGIVHRTTKKKTLRQVRVASKFSPVSQMTRTISFSFLFGAQFRTSDLASSMAFTALRQLIIMTYSTVSSDSNPNYVYLQLCRKAIRSM